jgi:hypothetical protein
MNNAGDSAEDQRCLLQAMRASGFATSLREASHKGCVFFRRLENMTRSY